jgi:starch synthase
MVTRLVGQKGIELLIEPLPEALARSDARYVVLGSGETRFERFFAQLEASFPGRVRFWRGFDERLAHRIEAGADMFLMPSLYEPCGLTQMRAQRYGALPVARRVGGLADTIMDGETGFLFDEYTPEAFTAAALRGLYQFVQHGRWRAMMQSAMARDFSWERSAAPYISVYRRALDRAAAGT